jgi:hypothetical protein
MILGYTRTFDEVFGSDVNYSKWRFAQLIFFDSNSPANTYRVGMGGFFHNENADPGLPAFQW